MITQISNIKDFGVFRNFKWPADLDDFKRYNVFYGWNYSGKTTLSRLLRCYELGRFHDDFKDGTFVIKDGEGKSYDQTRLNEQPLAIRVFNSDFVEENVRWEEGLEPIFMLGEKNIELEKELNEKRSTLDQKKKELDECRSKKTEKETAINKNLTDRARDITGILSLGRTFTKKHFEEKIQGMVDFQQHILSDEDINSHLTKYNRTEKKGKIVLREPVTSLAYEIETVQELLSRKISAKVIQKLKNNPMLNEWMRKGKDLHEGKSVCEFCGNKLPKNLLEELDAHFSDEYKKLLSEIDTCINNLDLKKIAIDMPDKASFYRGCENEYKGFLKEFAAKSQKYNIITEEMESKLKEKKTDVFHVVSMDEISDNSFKVNDAIANINAVIENHNQKTDKFEQDKDTAKNKLLEHYSAEFIRGNHYHEVCKEIDGLETKQQGINAIIQAIQENIREIENQLSDAAKGAETINKYLISYFGKDDIRVEAAEEGKFKLKRFENNATNLSEGEKTAISFAYFVSKLYDRSTDISNSIIFIDDPVSSLDTNHLFHTYSMIKNTFEKCKQLFISTHNFELFNLIKEWLEKKPLLKQHSYYLVKREVSNNNITSSITNLPSELEKFKSEYHYLFSIIYDFYKAPSSGYGVLYNLPNLARRLLEAFMGFKIPTHEGLAKKLPLLIKDVVKREKVLKFINQYSHNTSLPRTLQHLDLSECEEVINIVLQSMYNKDTEHYKCLLKEIDGSVKSEQNGSKESEQKRKKAKDIVVIRETKAKCDVGMFFDSIKIKTIGRAAARPDSWVIESADYVVDSYLKSFACAHVCGDTFDPVARYGQYVLLAQQDEIAVDGDLVAVESHDGSRYLRRMTVDNNILFLYSINPVKVESSVQIKRDNSSIHKVLGVIYESNMLPKTYETRRNEEWHPCKNFDSSFFDNLKMIIVEGDSLEPIARKGQKVIVDVPNKGPDQYSIENGGLAAVETQDCIGCVIKRIFRSEDEWILTSQNPLAAYPPDIIPVEKIDRVWPLRGVIFETE